MPNTGGTARRLFKRRPRLEDLVGQSLGVRLAVARPSGIRSGYGTRSSAAWRTAVRSLTRSTGVTPIPFSAHVFDNLAVADRLRSCAAQSIRVFQYPSSLINEAPSEHLLDPAIDPLVEQFPRPMQNETAADSAGRARSNCFCSSLMGVPLFSIYLEGSNDSPRQSFRVQPPGRYGVDGGQSTVQLAGA